MSAAATAQPSTQDGVKAAKSRTAENTSLVSQAQEKAIRGLADEIHRLNHAVIKAVEAGVSVELIRSSRHHADGSWGDLMVPIIAKNDIAKN